MNHYQPKIWRSKNEERTDRRNYSNNTTDLRWQNETIWSKTAGNEMMEAFQEFVITLKVNQRQIIQRKLKSGNCLQVYSSEQRFELSPAPSSHKPKEAAHFRTSAQTGETSVIKTHTLWLSSLLISTCVLVLSNNLRLTIIWIMFLLCNPAEGQCAGGGSWAGFKIQR